ncbi:MAG: hypothetical protein JSW58_17505, partial [Candidatus Latescibacterota bacterium]
EARLPGRTFLVALPPAGGYSVRHTVQRSQSLGKRRLEPVPFPLVLNDDDGEPFASQEYRIDPQIYDRAPSLISVAADPVARIRHQRVLPIRVNPVAYDPVSGETVLAMSIRVEVTLRGGPDSRSGLRDVGDVPVRESRVWERIYTRILVNPQQAEKWRVKPSRRPRNRGQRARTYQALTGPLVKLRVRDSGLHRVRANSAIDKGLPPGTQISELHVFKRVYDSDTLAETIVDIPFRVVEDPAGTAGVFDGSDWLVFYGHELREDTFQNDPLEKFSDWNVYWLGTSSGSQMVSEDVPPGVVSADTATVTFSVVDYYEQDNFFFDGTPPGHKEFYFYNDVRNQTLSIPFVVGAIDPTGTFQLKARYLGGDRTRLERSVKMSIINSKGTTQLDPASVPRKNLVDYESQVLPANVIDEGLNTLRVDKTSDRLSLEALLDWFTIEYRSHYRAMGNVIDFTTGTLTGDTSIAVTGFTHTDVMLFDVTDPLAPREYRLTPAHFTDVGGGYALSFRETITLQKRFIATSIDGVEEITPSDVLGDNPSSMIGGAAESGVDILVVCHEDFMSDMQSWVSYRKAQGYSVLFADAEDIFDEFNGGVPHARGIKNFVRHFFETGGASFVVLVGDASEDNKRVHALSGINYVPTESFTEFVGGSFQQDEVVTTDKWYVMLDCDFINDDTPCSDYYPDLLLGRLPVGSSQETQNVLNKIFSFEEPSGTDFWRRRIIRVADNAFSPEDNPFELCYKSSEDDFETAEEQAAVIFEDGIPGGFDVIRFYLTEKINEPPHEPRSCGSGSNFSSQTRGDATPALIGEFNKGATVVSIQAHMNRHVICHEWLLTSSYASPDGKLDHRRMENVGRPWIIYGMGCHMSDYAVNKEREQTQHNDANGDAFAELLLFRPNRGAVATYASTGFEFLYPNLAFTEYIANAFFENVPTDPMVGSGKAQARWIFGELMAVAEIENLNNNRYFSGGGPIGQMKRYHLLGDPVLRIDGGPPRFDVTVNDKPFESGDRVVTGAGQGIDVRAIVTDEVAIEQLRLEIDNADSTHLLSISPLVDESLTAARQYEVRFEHSLQAKSYDIVLKAYQAEDTTSNNYHIVAEFVFKVQVNATLKVNGRPIANGDLVPPQGDYVFELDLPVYVEPSLIRVETDGEPVSPIDITNPDPQDSTTWHIRFSQQLPTGKHTVTLIVEDTEFPFEVVVGSQFGLFDVVAYPNPFVDDVFFVFSNEVQISSGKIDVFTTSGKKVAHLEVPLGARAPGQNAVRWNGRTFNGDEIANGVYLFVVSVDQGGRETIHRGKLVRVK